MQREFIQSIIEATVHCACGNTFKTRSTIPGTSKSTFCAGYHPRSLRVPRRLSIREGACRTVQEEVHAKKKK